ncbi:FixH family protein [Lacibacter sp. H375]|uniref:FixH family protein n=1 Tax=Lacibacter sp. H375 TaxID=3133424 RepID=UPI0030BC61C2
MTLNWGHKITLAFSAFVVFMFVMVYKSMKTDFQLVTKEYYKDELAYQQVIDGTNRANKLSSSVEVTQLNNELIIQLPAEMKGKTISGNIWLYCSSDDKKDRRLELTVDENGKQVIDSKNMMPANYLLKVTWKAEELNYYNEQRLELK